MTESNNLRIEIFRDHRLLFSESFGGALEIGRQRMNELAPIAINFDTKPPRLVIAPSSERTVSRDHARIEQVRSEIIVSNISSKSEILLGPLGGSQTLKAGDSETISLPLTFQIGNWQVKVQPVDAQLLGLEQMSLPPSIHGSLLERTLASPVLQEFRSPDQMDGPELMAWLRNILDLFQASPGNAEFFEQSNAVVAQMLKLDSAAILFRENGQWTVKHLYRRVKNRFDDEWRPSMTILNEVCKNVRAYRQLPTASADQPQSLLGVSSLVAAPILSVGGEVIGALYGDKRADQTVSTNDISEVETMFVELLASGIAAGLARLEQEKQVVQARVRFEQFFPTGLVDKLENDQDFLKGKNSDVTVMFCDIRKFSQISEQVGPETTVAFISDALQMLSECVQTHEGVLVDYIADELIAMWGAPETQPDHATMAVRAAQDMMNCVPVLNDRWKERIGTDFQIGIGLNSGIAQVGNIGSQLRFKYGPLGNPVNIASRIQGVTKMLRIPFLATENTAARLDSSIPYRKLCQVQLVNVSQPVMVCEIAVDADDDWMSLKSSYEEGLELFEQQAFLEACDKLSATLKRFPHDTPTMKLLSRAVNLLSEGNGNEESIVWKLDSK